MAGTSLLLHDANDHHALTEEDAMGSPPDPPDDDDPPFRTVAPMSPPPAPATPGRGPPTLAAPTPKLLTGTFPRLCTPTAFGLLSGDAAGDPTFPTLYSRPSIEPPCCFPGSASSRRSTGGAAAPPPDARAEAAPSLYDRERLGGACLDTCSAVGWGAGADRTAHQHFRCGGREGLGEGRREERSERAS